ncbi:DegT/DnrJ/EryC1/StrS family aminotransferase [Sporosarcina highlanderae]|uniref:DegT/DnrJ/EryC1/StrS family aminotransferase n=1 Tax=Sporosarcina highlanderae TaxID=3035916 RepID=A0ABT8JLA1_9BACL|nr:DegT/DnrJ/EryC1/StrS family aminotransferase [Sporosarcina highlanderae]MDN4605930.1 DegT/DnrJ/EryC1/StrS family aminotransferase [Sporosarcina highlanderae]
MFNEIGSNFYLNTIEGMPRVEYDNYNDTRQHVFLDTGRSAIRLALDNIDVGRKVAILPMYTCHTVIQPFIEHGYEISFYDIDFHFQVDIDEFKQLINEVKPSVILVHAYFGFDTLIGIREYLKTLRNHGIYILEDITQSYLSNMDYETANFYVCSIRKWLAIPDGGFLKSTSIEINKPSLLINEKYIKKQKSAMLLKSEYIKKLNPNIKVQYNKIFGEAKRIIDNQTGIYEMSDLSKNLLQVSDIHEIKIRRKNNYYYLLQQLKDEKNIVIPLNICDENVTPLFFPIFIKNRMNLQKYMAQNNIYLPIIWPKSEFCVITSDSKSKYIYENILCIPCDQRYFENDMERVVSLLKKYLKEEEI